MAAESKSDPKFDIGHVLFVDIVGFSKLLINEQTELVRKLNEIVRGTNQVRLAEAEGKLVCLPTGDGIALVFRNSPEAPVQCALEISQALKAHPQIQLRMGIHSGPVNVVVDVNGRPNITGAGINIAQRIMDCGEAGHILLSRRAADDLAQYRKWQPYLHELGEFEVKHGTKVALVNLYTEKLGNPQVPEKLKQFSRKQATTRYVRRALVAGLLLLAGFYFFASRSNFRSAVAEKSIAVLPFENKNGDADTEYLSEGIPEALINSLAELQQLKVIARSTAFHYRGKDGDPQAVGRQLKVRAVLTGRVRQIGDALDIQVDLVDAQTGAQLWGEMYQRKVSDVLLVKQAIAQEVTERLSLRLSGQQQRQLTKRDTTNAEAYRFYLKGRYYWNKRTANGLTKAIEQFQQSIDRDPNYALGYVGLADSYLIMEEYSGAAASETLQKARAAADRALQIDDSLSEAHASSAYIYQGLWRWAEAEEEFKHAIRLNPNYPTAHQWFSIYLRARQRFNEDESEIRRAQELDPLSSIISSNVAVVYLLKNDLKAAIEECQRIIELDPTFPFAHGELGFAYLKQRRDDAATEEFHAAVELSGRASVHLSDLGYCYAVTGKRDQALAILKELEDKYAKRESIGQYLAGVYAGLGDKDQTFAWLERDYQQHSGYLPTITWWYYFEDVRSDPRYADLLRRMRLQP